MSEPRPPSLKCTTGRDECDRPRDAVPTFHTHAPVPMIATIPLAERTGYTGPMESLTGLLGPVAIIFLALVVASACVRVLRQYERGVMFTLGRFSGVRGPGSSS